MVDVDERKKYVSKKNNTSALLLVFREGRLIEFPPRVISLGQISAASQIVSTLQA